MTPARTLSDLQRWMLAAVTEPATAADGDLQSAILPSRQQSAAERLAVYQNAYLARLLDVLREQFPCTRCAAGDETFDQLALGYLQAHPPHSYTLSRLADRWPEHLDATRPADWGEFVVELAQLEQAIDRVFDGPGPEGRPPFVLPAGADESLRLSFVPGWDLHSFAYPVSTYYTAWKAAAAPDWPAQNRQWVALWRRDYIVRRLELTAVQFGLLRQLQEGATLGEALRRAGQPRRLSYEDVRESFQTWSAAGFFANAPQTR